MSSLVPEYAWSTPLPFAPREPQALKIPTQLDGHADCGVPIGGIGTGGIARGANGGFTRFTLQAGRVHWQDRAENGFAFWQEGVPARALRPTGTGAEALGWRFDPAGRQASLFPKMWHAYEDAPVRLVLEQLSPVAPGLEADRDLPVGIVRAHLQNTANAPRAAAVMLTFSNIVGWFGGVEGVRAAGGVAGQTNAALDENGLVGVTMTREHHGPLDMGEGTFVIAARAAAAVETTRILAFDPRREGPAVWDGFAREGRIAAPGESWTSGGGFSEFPASQPCGALCARVVLAPGEKRTIDFAIVWDLPVIRFGQGRRHLRHYTSRWGADGTAAPAIAAHALSSVDAWSDAIDAFHESAATDLALSPAATALALNELYFLVDGLTAWTSEGHFALIECPDYPLYGTLDLWVYAAAAVDRVFPDLAQEVTRAYAAEVSHDDPQTRLHLRSTARFPRARPGMLPHDLGAPNADPFHRTNDYVYQDSAAWKDLNAMFVLCAARDVRRAPELAAGLVEPVSIAMEALAAFDRDGDGLIENDGFPDQTFDNIPMSGISAYCGGLWLAALRAAAMIASHAGDLTAAERWRAASATAEPAFTEALWTGSVFRVDSAGPFREAFFAEQLFGPATARLLGLGDCVDPDRARAALAALYRANFLEAGRGRGVLAVTSREHSSSLYAPKGEEGLQWDEILIGFNYSFAATLRAYGLEAECHRVLDALAEELGPRRGLHFRTPAAIVPEKPLYRAQMNMRPLAIWMLVDAKRAADMSGWK